MGAACVGGAAEEIGVSEQMSLLNGLSPLSRVDGDAEFSPCGKYRYWLSRDWGFRRFSDGREQYALWIGMNPSTATATEDDPTIRREMSYTRRLGLARYIKVNIMDYRATNPKDLLVPGVTPCSEGNAECIRSAASKAAAIIVCHGRLPGALRVFSEQAMAQLIGKPLLCLGRNIDGSPKHPLYLRSNADFVSFVP